MNKWWIYLSPDVALFVGTWKFTFDYMSKIDFDDDFLLRAFWLLNTKTKIEKIPNNRIYLIIQSFASLCKKKLPLFDHFWIYK